METNPPSNKETLNAAGKFKSVITLVIQSFRLNLYFSMYDFI